MFSYDTLLSQNGKTFERNNIICIIHMTSSIINQTLFQIAVKWSRHNGRKKNEADIFR